MKADTHIRAVYTASQEREGEALNRYLAARALAQTMLHQEARAYLASLVAQTASTPLDDEPATHLAAYLAKKLVYGETVGDVSPERGNLIVIDVGRSKQPMYSATPDPWSPPSTRRPLTGDTAIVVPPDARTFVADQRTREAATVTLAQTEEEKALKALLTDTAVAGTSRVTKIAGSLVRSLIQCQNDFFAQQSVKYLTQVLDKSFGAFVEPLADRAARELQLRIRRALGSGNSVDDAARISTVSGLTDLTVRIPAQYLRLAGEQAKEYLRYSFLSVPHDFAAVLLMQRYSTKARELLDDFAPGSRDAAVDMTPVLAQAERVMPDVTRALRDNAERQQIEMEVAKIRREVEKARERERERIVR